MSAPLPYRLATGAPVTNEAARAIWAAVAREVLEQAAAGSSVMHSELARQVQQRSGVYTRLPAAEWLPAVIADVDDAALTARVRPDAAPVSARVRAATVRRPRAETAKPKRQEAPPAICPTCFMQLPASGRCDTCG